MHGIIIQGVLKLMICFQMAVFILLQKKITFWVFVTNKFHNNATIKMVAK